MVDQIITSLPVSTSFYTIEYSSDSISHLVAVVVVVIVVIVVRGCISYLNTRLTVIKQTISVKMATTISSYFHITLLF